MGGLVASQKEFPEMKPGLPWNHRPEPHSKEDIDQAISAKIHLNLRLLPLLAEAQHLSIEPEQVGPLPEWGSPEEAIAYASEAELPSSPLFLDLEALGGHPVAWDQETWPLPFYLRGALCWQRDELLSIVPFGSVGSSHPWGGTDYQAWSRWVHLQGHPSEWPKPGPGDFMARASGDSISWVDIEQDSICAQHGRVALNLCRVVLSVLMSIEAFEIELVQAKTSRQVRRRAERKGERIGLVAANWPIRPVKSRDAKEIVGAVPASSELAACQIPKTHARLNQCHGHWHEALEHYADPDGFVGPLNATIQGLRSVTWVMQKELAPEPGFKEWYAARQERMRADSRMRWLVDARNKIEKQGDLDTHSVAHVRVVGPRGRSAPEEIDVDSTAEAHEIAREINVSGLPSWALDEGTLLVERRWTLEELAGDEILDVLAHCHGVLLRILSEAHDEFGEGSPCELEAAGICEGVESRPHPSGRLPCMLANRESRSARRDLRSGALIEHELRSYKGPVPSLAELSDRYGAPPPFVLPSESKTVFDVAAAFHKWGRKMLIKDGYHLTFAWLFRDGERASQVTLYPENQRDKFLAIERLTAEAERLGADEVMFASEAWEASAVEHADPRASLHAEEREDKGEVFITVAMRRGGECRQWRSEMNRNGDELSLGEAESMEITPPPFLAPFQALWEGWGLSDARGATGQGQ